jgi:hypothetical protein
MLNNRCVPNHKYQLVRTRLWHGSGAPSIGFPFKVAMNACKSTGMSRSTALACKNTKIQHLTLNTGKRVPK